MVSEARAKPHTVHRLWIALPVLLLLALLPAPAGAASRGSCLASTEDAPLQELAARGYARDHGVSFEEAMRRLDLQGRVSWVADALQGSLGEHNAGAWFDATDGGRFKLGYTAGADLGPPLAIVAACHLQGDVVLVPLSWSWSQMISAQDALTQRLLALGIDERWSNGLTVVGERFVIEVEVAVNGLPPAASAAIDGAIAPTPVPVVRIDHDRADMLVTPAIGAPFSRPHANRLRHLARQGRTQLGPAYACAVQPHPNALRLLVTRRAALTRARDLLAHLGGPGRIEVRLTSPRYRYTAMTAVLRRARSRLGHAAARLESPIGRSHCPRVVVRAGPGAERRRAASLRRRFGHDRVVIRRG